MTGVATTTRNYRVIPSPLLHKDLKILPLSAEDDITSSIKGLPEGVLVLKGEGRSQTVTPMVEPTQKGWQVASWCAPALR